MLRCERQRQNANRRLEVERRRRSLLPRQQRPQQQQPPQQLNAEAEVFVPQSQQFQHFTFIPPVIFAPIYLSFNFKYIPQPPPPPLQPN
ncbi:hypothetical protein PVAND_011314 [Polypedilum vanderplanki]|uniref:Uncharacterized protein n=1 Tax=Polypedilum vanderplanki TaxID=319348 RepID=A0A9J6CK02_POLVA|nr:hypothetical protein PVAND_011314 [Polypedilum vanderplanki]